MSSILEIFHFNESQPAQIVMLQYKVQRCQDEVHLLSPQTFYSECYNYHTSSDRRRPIFSMTGNLQYSALLCPQLNAAAGGGEKSCSEDCLYAHNLYEQDYHITTFRTKICSNLDHL